MPSYHTWGIWLLFVFGSFLVFEIWAVITRRPTLSQTTWRWQEGAGWRRWLVFAGLQVLAAHLCFKFL